MRLGLACSKRDPRRAIDLLRVVSRQCFAFSELRLEIAFVFEACRRRGLAPRSRPGQEAPQSTFRNVQKLGDRRLWPARIKHVGDQLAFLRCGLPALDHWVRSASAGRNSLRPRAQPPQEPA
jgi:hypothetical protein